MKVVLGLVLFFSYLTGYAQVVDSVVNKKYGDGEFALRPGLVSADTSIAQVFDGNMVEIRKAGVVEIKSDSVVYKVIIDKAALTITANDTARCYGMPDPVFTVRYSGWVYDETPAVLSSLPVVKCDANNTLIPGGANADNYTIDYENGHLTVYKLPVASVSADRSTVLCGPRASLGLSATGNYAFTWLKNDTAMVDEQGNSLEVMAPGEYKVRVTDQHGCVNTSVGSVKVTQVLLPYVDFSYGNACTGNSINLKNTSNASGDIDYSWHSGDGQSSNNYNASFTYMAAGTYTVVLTATPAGCPAMGMTAMHDIYVTDPPAARSLPAVAAEPGKVVQLNARKVEGASYQWMPGAGLSDSTISDPKAVLSAPQGYLIRVVQRNGCVVTDTLKVSVSNPRVFLVQDEFSPNGDGKNDLLQVYGQRIKKVISFDVYDRSGNLVYQKPKKGEVAWDGKSNGKKVPDGIYIWMAVGSDYYGKVLREQGTVTVAR